MKLTSGREGYESIGKDSPVVDDQRNPLIWTQEGHCQDDRTSVFARLAEDALGADGSKFGEVAQDIEHRLLVEGFYFTICKQDIYLEKECEKKTSRILRKPRENRGILENVLNNTLRKYSKKSTDI